jgi:phytoene dehydrogenase-like protein
MESTDNTHYEAIVIGAGMAGLAAGIRLRLGGKKVLILERHEAPGGLNSFYRLGGRQYDVGLHAMTNYVPPGVKRTPLVKLLRQLRLKREDLDLAEQTGSRVSFPGVELPFTNDFLVLENAVAEHFPKEIDGFRRLTAIVREFDATSLEGKDEDARPRMREFIKDRLLEDMLLCPLMYYGSAREHDMDFGQFVILFRSIFLEGFARPYEGVRRIIRALTRQYASLGGERKMRQGVRRITAHDGLACELELDDGSCLSADHILSTAGAVETERLINGNEPETAADNVGRLSFVETITVLDQQPEAWGWEDTIVFFSTSERFHYERPEDRLVDPRSGVICFPNNYCYSDNRQLPEGIMRLTALANYDRWKALPEDEYRSAKAGWFDRLQRVATDVLPKPPALAPSLAAATLATDMFTPTTVERYTGHLGGAVYGATRKQKDGRTRLANLYLAGTDQGFLGITGAMLSGISIANRYILQSDG